jgi:hypothetical protein
MSKPTPFNVARITHTFVTSEAFELPEDFDEQELLRYAWGIWTRDRAPEIVKLRFTGTEAIRRVKETIWHPLQAPPQDQPDGSCLWEAPIAEWQEMVPWFAAGGGCGGVRAEGLGARCARSAKAELSGDGTSRNWGMLTKREWTVGMAT